jgi:energy-coupling factor transporter ATP-binding protein EcfA2
MRIVNIGCIGPEGLTVELDNILCLVGANNCGKSTVLRAYELAVGTEIFSKERDLCQRAGGMPASVELWVHIPQGIENIAEKWKTPDHDLLLVHSRWQWSAENNWARIRQTWDPEINDFGDDKASGLDPVFSSRLPKPFRIGTLDDPAEEHKKLLTLVLQPVADKLKAKLEDSDSDLSKALAAFTNTAKIPVNEEREKLNSVQKDLNHSHNEIFPDLSIGFNIGLGDVKIDPVALLLKNSQLKFQEWASEVQWYQQGTGSQRALFWTMLQVRSKLSALSDLILQSKKELIERQKQIAKLTKEIESSKKEETKQKKRDEIKQLSADIEAIKLREPEKLLQEQGGQLALPGYMLLIDEPEVALHPGAVRAASRYLYGLTDDPAWQVMITTHSPAFIDPLHDHTTIVRLDRSLNNPTPSTYRSDAVDFPADAKEKLKMLNRFDQGLAEMFFGQYPIVIEGDTEFAAFETVMRLCAGEFPVQKRPVLVRARGKWTIRLVIKMLTHFKVHFSILHDADSPRRRDGNVNGAWTANTELHAEIGEARKAGVRVVHRISVPNFEYVHLPVEKSADGSLKGISDEDKPWNMNAAVKEDMHVQSSVKALLKDLTSSTAKEEPFDGPFETGLQNAVKSWVAAHGIIDVRYAFD